MGCDFLFGFLMCAYSGHFLGDWCLDPGSYNDGACRLHSLFWMVQRSKWTALLWRCQASKKLHNIIDIFALVEFVSAPPLPSTVTQQSTELIVGKPPPTKA